jgi:CheY-like chemotaxis protein
VRNEGWGLESEKGEGSAFTIHLPAEMERRRGSREVDGFTFLEEMRKRDDLAQVPVIVVTAKDLTAEDHKRLNGEVDNILQKGDDDREKLMDEVHRYVNRAHAA